MDSSKRSQPNATINCQTVLRAIARQNQARISKSQVYDPNVCTSRAEPARRWASVVIEGQPFLIKTSFVKGGFKVRLYASDEFLEVQELFHSDLDRISINKPNRVHFLRLAGQLSLPSRDYDLFTENGALTARQQVLIKDTDFQAFIQDISLSQEESVHLSAGDVKIYLRQRSVESALGVIGSSLNFVKKIASKKLEIDFSELPPQFKPIIPLISTWGKTDDSHREELRENANRKELQAVVAEVRPYFPAINEYLDSFRDQPMPEVATLLGALAEFAAETELLLKEAQ